jgi:glycosyltransferase involved in cell wall biosynthesis
MKDAPAPAVAVVTAARNMERYIGATVDSVLRQTLSDFEMMVVDDGSTDATAAIVNAAADSRLDVIRGAGAGVSSARNRGLEACCAPLVVFLDADDLLMPDALRRMVATMATHPDQVACFGHHVKIGEDGTPLGSPAPAAFKQLPAKDTLRHLLCSNFIVNGGALCIRTAAARRVGGYDPKLRFGEDWEFWCRLAALGDFVALLDFVALQYRLRVAGANRALAGSPFHPNLEALDVIYRAPAPRERFSATELRRFRRLAESNVHWAAARNELIEGRLLRFGAYLLAGALNYPDSVFQWRRTWAFFRGLPPVWHRG